MENREKFFDETFKILLSVTVSVWVIYVAFLLFAGDSKVCTTTPPDPILNVMAIAAGVLTAPPLVYGLVRLLFWPKSPRSGSVWLAAWVICCGVGIFVGGAVLLAFALLQYGCR